MIRMITFTLALVCTCMGETLMDVDFAASTRRVDAQGIGSFHGVLPARVSENFTGWSAGHASSEVGDEGGRKFLRIVTKSGDAGGQFVIGGFEPSFPGYFRLRVTARGSLSLGLRLHGEPYTGYSQHAFNSQVWDEKTYLFAVNRKREGGVGLYFYTGAGTVDIARIALETATEADLAEAIPRPPKALRSFVRHSRFPLGLPCGWNLGRDCVGTTCVADRDERAADGLPVLKVVSDTPWELRGEAFQTGYPGDRHTLSFRYRSTEPIQASVLDERNRVVVCRTIQASAAWREERVVFTAPMLAHSLGLCFTGARGPFRLDHVRVCAGEGMDCPQERSCGVALSVLEGEIASDTRIQFTDEPARVAYRIMNAPQGAVLKATASDIYGRVRPLKTGEGQDGTLDYAVFPDAAIGQFRVSAWLEKGGERISGEEELVVTRLARPRTWGRDAPESPFGCHFNPNRGVVRTMKAGGVNWVRLHDAGEQVSNWYAQEPEKGKWNFHDEEVAVYRDVGMKIFAQLGTAPTWASHYGDLGYSWFGYYEKYLRPTNDVDWVNYVMRYVKHHERNIDEYFVWNEPWGRWWDTAADAKFYDKSRTRADFAALQRLTYDAVKKVNPRIRVAGFNTTSGIGGRDWTAGVMEAGGFDCCDIVDWHYYTSHPRGLRGEATISALPLEPIRKSHPDLGGKPFYMSEGQGTSNGSSWIDDRMSGLLRASVPWKPESVADYSRLADMTCRYVVSLLAEGNSKVYLYSAHAYSGLAQVPTFLTLLGADGFAHPALVAHAQLARALEGKRFVRQEDAGRAGVMYVFAKDRDTVAVYSNLAKDEALGLLSKGRPLDLYGNPVSSATYIPGTLVYIFR